ncbi:MAG: ATP-grasp domain-containing protein [Alphaproteobacteria bacterium]|nr:ATP-grasp domain-containing protein [Alphaproteobacteria bacterium]
MNMMVEIPPPRVRAPHQGMPPLDMSGPPVSYFEFWPQRYFYAPMMLYWAWLTLKHGGRFSLPTAANPAFPMGGWIGESKAAVFDVSGDYARSFIAPWAVFDRAENSTAAEALAAARKAGLAFPFVVKPDLGCRGVGVRRVRNERELADYIAAFPIGRRMVFQKLVDLEAEAGIFYVRRPNEARGRIISLTLKYFPHVYGDGTSTLKQLIEGDRRAGPLADIYLPRHKDRLDMVLPAGEPFRIAFAGSHSRGTIFRNGNDYVTEAMTYAFDRIAKDVKEFYFGRFDVRFSSIEALQAGRDFTIVEINGVGAESTHIWDRKTTLREAYAALMKQYAAMWEIGAMNAKRGFKPASVRELWRAYRDEVKLWAEYPLTE